MKNCIHFHGKIFFGMNGRGTARHDLTRKLFVWKAFVWKALVRQSTQNRHLIAFSEVIAVV
ncbi:hypothetical protein [Desulfamplus magnetovallimortis]|nr:hypothetical protein [Desulfamplus magnetovallimortis]